MLALEAMLREGEWFGAPSRGQFEGYAGIGKVLCVKMDRRKGLSEEIVGRDEQNTIEFRLGSGTMELPVMALI